MFVFLQSTLIYFNNHQFSRPEEDTVLIINNRTQVYSGTYQKHVKTLEDLRTAEIELVPQISPESELNPCMLEGLLFRSLEKQPWRLEAEKQLKIPLFYSEPDVCRPERGSAQTRLFDLVRAHRSDFQGGEHLPLYQMRPETSPLEPESGAVKLVSDVVVHNAKLSKIRGTVEYRKGAQSTSIR